jgi:GT2 family glycosyltransferase
MTKSDGPPRSPADPGAPGPDPTLRPVDGARDGDESAAGTLTPALAWLAERLVEATLPEEPGEPPEPDWGVGGGWFPPSYWHWIHEWELYRATHADELAVVETPVSGPLLSVVVPVYRPLLWYFRECVLSVIRQTYGNWELCLCDDGSGDAALTKAMHQFAAEDPRIKVTALERNGGISRATNRALEAATGEFVVLLDHDDVLEPDALAEVVTAIGSGDDVDVVYSDEDKLDELDRRYLPMFKPDWDPDLLLVYPYLGHLLAIRRDIVDHLGGFRPEFDGSQDYDIMLRSTELARQVVHIPKVLYHWRAVAGSAALDPEAKPWAHQASRRVVEDAVARRGIDGWVETGPFQGAYHVRRRIHGAPTVSVIIPFRDQAALTAACLASLEDDPGYPLSEVALVDNGSTDPETRALRRQLERRPATRIIDYPGAFNWAAINNLAAATCTTDMVLFMNNDIEATTGGWLHALVELAQRPDVGAVGARLLYPDGKLQHGGVVLGFGGLAGHIFTGMPKGRRANVGWDQMVREYSAVTAACMLVRRSVFEELGGFEEALAVGYNDVDFCIRLRRAGYRILYTPHAELTHYESVSRGFSGYNSDVQEFLARWFDLIRSEDPFYNPNLSRLDARCPLRKPGEDEEWLSMVTGLIQADYVSPGATAGERRAASATGPLTTG